MADLSEKLLNDDTGLEQQMAKELRYLNEVLDALPSSIKSLLELQGEIDGGIYCNGFLDTLEIVVNHETSLKTQEELKGIKQLIERILAS